jgi:hypothetical protein
MDGNTLLGIPTSDLIGVILTRTVLGRLSHLVVGAMLGATMAAIVLGWIGQ